MTTDAKPNKFAQRREATRAGLVALGIQRFRDKGYTATTVEDLVQGSDYTRGAFYFHFADKEEFFLEVLRARAGLRPEWWTLVRDPALTTTREAIEATLTTLAATPGDGPDWLFTVVDFFQAVKGDESRTAVLRELYEQWLDELERWIGELVERSFARSDLPPRALAAEVFAATEGYTIHTALYGADPAGLIDVLTRVVQP